MQDLSVTIVQTELFWEDADKNLEMFTQKLSTLEKQTDLLILPEMFNTGFSMRAEALAEKMEGKSIQWMAVAAAQKSCVVVASLIIEEDGGYYNRLIWMRPDGTSEYYDKRHLFRMADEHQNYRYGVKRLVVNLKQWRICPLICYDLRFPVWSRNKNDIDCLIYTANWPEVRNFAWKSLLPARAIENQVYVIGVNRIGTDGNEKTYSGDSVVLDPTGATMAYMAAHAEGFISTTLSYTELQNYRQSFQVGLDADEFTLK